MKQTVFLFICIFILVNVTVVVLVTVVAAHWRVMDQRVMMMWSRRCWLFASAASALFFSLSSGFIFLMMTISAMFLMLWVSMLMMAGLLILVITDRGVVGVLATFRQVEDRTSAWSYTTITRDWIILVWLTFSLVAWKSNRKNYHCDEDGHVLWRPKLKSSFPIQTDRPSAYGRWLIRHEIQLSEWQWKKGGEKENEMRIFLKAMKRGNMIRCVCRISNGEERSNREALLLVDQE